MVVARRISTTAVKFVVNKVTDLICVRRLRIKLTPVYTQ